METTIKAPCTRVRMGKKVLFCYQFPSARDEFISADSTFSDLFAKTYPDEVTMVRTKRHKLTIRVFERHDLPDERGLTALAGTKVSQTKGFPFVSFDLIRVKAPSMDVATNASDGLMTACQKRIFVKPEEFKKPKASDRVYNRITEKMEEMKLGFNDVKHAHRTEDGNVSRIKGIQFVRKLAVLLARIAGHHYKIKRSLSGSLSIPDIFAEFDDKEQYGYKMNLLDTDSLRCESESLRQSMKEIYRTIDESVSERWDAFQINITILRQCLTKHLKKREKTARKIREGRDFRSHTSNRDNYERDYTKPIPACQILNRGKYGYLSRKLCAQLAYRPILMNDHVPSEISSWCKMKRKRFWDNLAVECDIVVYIHKRPRKQNIYLAFRCESFSNTNAISRGLVRVRDLIHEREARDVQLREEKLSKANHRKRYRRNSGPYRCTLCQSVGHNKRRCPVAAERRMQAARERES